MTEEDKYTLVIKPKYSAFDINFRELWHYRDLLLLFVKRDFVSVYKQTILGPVWFFIQPILMTITFTWIFGVTAGLPTDGMPAPLFYLCGITFWNYFSSCITSTSNTFVSNAGIFGKVFFPRLILPLSVVISNLIKFGVQFLLFLCVYIYYFLTNPQIQPNSTAFLLPVYLLMMAGLGLGFGIIISSLTTKYRDLSFLVGFGVQLLMYISPILIPFSSISDKWRMIINLVNPMSSVIEAIKFGFLGRGVFDLSYLSTSFVYMLVVLSLGILMFNKTEKSFMDTV